MSNREPPGRETAEQRFERISKMPGVIIHRREGPPVPFVPTLRVSDGTTVREILGRDVEDDDQR